MWASLVPRGETEAAAWVKKVPWRGGRSEEEMAENKRRDGEESLGRWFIPAWGGLWSLPSGRVKLGHSQKLT